MSCGRNAEKCRDAGNQVGIADTTATWAAGRKGGGHCPECGGFLTAEGVCNNPKCGSGLTLARAGAGAEPKAVLVREMWRGEFFKGIPIKLANGVELESGQRFKGSKYAVPLGKKRNIATVGQTITPAVDQIIDWNWGEGDKTCEVTLSDGGKGYYDPKTRSSVCDQGCVGLCHHQLAAALVGEAGGGLDSDGDALDLRSQLQTEVFDPRIDALKKGRLPDPMATEQVIRATDAAYAYLAGVLGESEIQTGDTSLLPATAATASDSGSAAADDTLLSGADGKGATSWGDMPERPAGSANEQVVALLHSLNVVPPLPTTAARLEAGDETYRGNPVPFTNPRYELDKPTKRVMTSMMRRMAASWRAARRRVEQAGGNPDDPAAYAGSMEDRAWGLYGPPGTGKNSLGKEIAAALGLGYMEADVHQRTDFQSLLADTVIESDGKGGTNTRVELGPLGRQLVEGGVAAVNEIVAADPDAQTALHQVVQDGIIRAPGPEGATTYWKVHPNSIILLTWNPNTTREDKPGDALLSRTPSYRMDFPEPADEARRLAKAMSNYFGKDISPQQVKRPVNLVNQLRSLYARGELESCPTARELESFTKEWLFSGDPEEAAELFRVFCSQGPDHDDQWQQVKNFASAFQSGHWKI